LGESTWNVLKKLMSAVVALAVPAILAISSPASASTVNLLTNGDFQNRLSGWKTQGPWLGIGAIGPDSFAYGGFEDGSNNYLSQSVATTIGASYTLSFDMRTAHLSGPADNAFAAGLDLTGADAKELLSFTNQDFANYTNYVLTFTALSPSTDISFFMQSLSGYWVLDNVSLTENDIAVTPLPGSAYLFMSGLGLIGFVAWRNKRSSFARSMAA
jgi:hypothetical protein